MAKLRLFKERRPEMEGEGQLPTSDLRGLDDPALLGVVGFEARLDFHGKISAESIRSLCHAYQLEPVPGIKWVSLRAVTRPGGSHKRDSLALFFAALESVRRDASLHARVHWVSSLYEVMKERSSGKSKPVYVKSVASLCLQSPVAQTLSEAGFTLDVHPEHDTLLNHGGVDMIHDQIEESRSKASHTRKVA